MTAKPIVAATDGSEESMRAVGWAAREAVLHGAPLRIVSAAPLLPRMAPLQTLPDRETVTGLIRSERDRAPAAAAHRAAELAPALPIGTGALEGQTAQAVIGSGSGAAMLVLGSRGIGGFAAMVLGSVSRYAAAHASCPVVVVRDDTGAVRGLVGVGIGDLDNCAGSLAFAFEEASLRRASLMAIHAWHMPEPYVSRGGTVSRLPDPHAVEAEAARQLARLLDQWRDKYPGVPVGQDVVQGHPARALAGLSARADLVVIGRHAKHPGLQGPGTVRHALLNHAHGTVAVVPSP
jgi:nucleotide-binding universal stress UspA family protein